MPSDIFGQIRQELGELWGKHTISLHVCPPENLLSLSHIPSFFSTYISKISYFEINGNLFNLPSDTEIKKYKRTKQEITERFDKCYFETINNVKQFWHPNIQQTYVTYYSNKSTATLFKTKQESNQLNQTMLKSILESMNKYSDIEIVMPASSQEGLIFLKDIVRTYLKTKQPIILSKDISKIFDHKTLSWVDQFNIDFRKTTLTTEIQKKWLALFFISLELSKNRELNNHLITRIESLLKVSIDQLRFEINVSLYEILKTDVTTSQLVAFVEHKYLSTIEPFVQLREIYPSLYIKFHFENRLSHAFQEPFEPIIPLTLYWHRVHSAKQLPTMHIVSNNTTLFKNENSYLRLSPQSEPIPFITGPLSTIQLSTYLYEELTSTLNHQMKGFVSPSIKFKQALKSFGTTLKASRMTLPFLSTSLSNALSYGYFNRLYQDHFWVLGAIFSNLDLPFLAHFNERKNHILTQKSASGLGVHLDGTRIHKEKWIFFMNFK